MPEAATFLGLFFFSPLPNFLLFAPEEDICVSGQRREPGAASSGSSPSSHLLTVDISFISHVTHGTANGMHRSRRAGSPSTVASVSKRVHGSRRGTAIPRQRRSPLRLRLFTGSWGSPPNRRSLALHFSAAGPVLPAVHQRFSCPRREGAPLCQRVLAALLLLR